MVRAYSPETYKICRLYNFSDRAPATKLPGNWMHAVLSESVPVGDYIGSDKTCVDVIMDDTCLR